MAPLRIRERHLLEESTHLCRIVVRDGCLQMLSKRRRLAKLAPEPTEEADGRLALHARGGYIDSSRAYTRLP